MDWSNNASLKQQVVLPIRTINKGSLFTEKIVQLTTLDLTILKNLDHLLKVASTVA